VVRGVAVEDPLAGFVEGELDLDEVTRGEMLNVVTVYGGSG
jgi:hypothetical protein